MLAAQAPEKLAHLEPYLIEIVGPHFRETGELSPEDYWLILIWKANRAKNNERRRLESKSDGDFSAAVSRIASALNTAESPRDRLGDLMKGWGMRLPVATAVLTILYPESFSVYDVRVCDELGRFHNLGHRRFSNALWAEYCDFVSAVESAAPKHLSLRQKDHFLWGRSLLKQVISELSAEVPERKKWKSK